MSHCEHRWDWRLLVVNELCGQLDQIYSRAQNNTRQLIWVMPIMKAGPCGDLWSRADWDLIAPRARNRFGIPIFEPKVFWEQMYRIEKNTCDIVGTVWRPTSDSVHSCKPASFWSPNPDRDRNNKPELGPSPTFIFKPDLVRKPNLPSESRYAQLPGIGGPTGTRFLHTQNSNLLDQNINLNQHKLSLLISANTAECNVSQQKNKLSRNFPRCRYRHKKKYFG